MQPVRLVIPGSFYDSYLYAGMLILWKTDGSVVTANWDRLVGSLSLPDQQRFAVNCAFQRSDLLYRPNVRQVLQDNDFRRLLESKFSDLGNTPMEIDERELYQRGSRVVDNPFPFPHAACTVFRYGMYIGGQSGVYVGRVENARGSIRIQLAERLWDVPALYLSTSYNTLAIASGNEGTFEYHLDSVDSSGTIGGREYRAGQRDNPLFSGHASVVEWLAYSLYSSSYLGKGYLADFKLNRSSKEFGESQQPVREVLQIIGSEEITGQCVGNDSAVYSWGVQDKICFAYSDRIEVVRYAPGVKKKANKFEYLGSVPLHNPLADTLVGATSTLFGIVFEFDDGLLVIDSKGDHISFPGEPVNWRVFHRSKYYENQLHAVYDDHLCVYSFNDDYLIEQQSKTVGTKFKTQQFYRGTSSSRSA